MVIRSDERKKSRELAHLANAGEFNRRYLTCQISAIFADRRDQRIKSPGVSPALDGAMRRIIGCVYVYILGYEAMLLVVS